MTQVADEQGFDPDENEGDFEDKSRRGRGYLASDVNRICLMYVSGELVIDEGKYMTPWTTGRILMEVDCLDAAPSSGAVARVFHQWEDWGYASFRQEPFGFVDFSELGRELGLEKFKEKLRDDRRKAAQKVTG